MPELNAIAASEKCKCGHARRWHNDEPKKSAPCTGYCAHPLCGCVRFRRHFTTESELERRPLYESPKKSGH